MPMLRTAVADLEYVDDGPAGGTPVILVHGFPDDPTTWDRVVARLPAGVRAIRPYVRGHGGSRVRDDAPDARGAQVAALGADVLDLAEGLGLESFVLAGHDWGSRAVHAAAVLAPERVTALVALSTSWGPRAHLTAGERLQDAAVAWYRYWLCTAIGRDAFAADPVPFLRHAWATWSPALGLTEAEEAALLEVFARNDQYVESVVHYYRHGTGEAPGAPRYAAAQAAIDAFPPIAVPTTFLIGGADGCEVVAAGTGNDAMYAAGYDARVLDGAGHFLAREAPDAVAAAIAEALAR
jgi:pimeloyl-ACP methyl ester carboxylesterase